MNPSFPLDPEPCVLHRAAWVVPVVGPPVENGAVLVRGGTVLDVGPFNELNAGKPVGTRIADHGNAALIPALVNAHCHLELTAMKERISLPKENFPAWLRELFPLQQALSPEEREHGYRRGIREAKQWGTGLLGDVMNGPPVTVSDSVPAVLVFREVLGFNLNHIDEALPAGEHDTAHMTFAAHACYSTSGELIRSVRERARAVGRPFSIHAAEHPEEMDFLRDGTGFFKNLLEFLGKMPPGWTPPAGTPVEYLDRLGVLDSGTLLVHAVHMTPEDWETVAVRGCKACFCPRSNHNLGVGEADIPRAAGLGISTCLGTDSLAGNTDLSLFAEAVRVLDRFPVLSPETVLRMATMGGAEALGFQQKHGSIERGKPANLLAVHLPLNTSSSGLLETVVHQGNQGAFEWVAQTIER